MILPTSLQAATLVIAEKGAAMIRQHWTSEPLSKHENSDGSNNEKEEEEEKKEREDEMARSKKFDQEL